ncbi:MAG: TonB family protein [Steroidobacteraceae bacterium]
MSHQDGSFARTLVRRAAHRAPPDLAERLEEEWLADLAMRRGPLARLLFALGCRWAARTIALEFGAPARIVAVRMAPATAAGPALVPDRPSAPQGSPRFIFLVAIVAMHAAIAYALILAFLPPPGLRPPTVSIGRVIDELAAPATPPPPIAGPDMTQPKVVVEPLPDFSFRTAPDPETAITATQLSTRTTPPPAHAVRRVAGGLGAGFPNAADFYPENYRRLGENGRVAKEGAVTVRACVDAAGRLTADPIVAGSSGDALFDASALELARAGSGRYRAATEDGAAVGSCFPFRVRFRMQ